MADASVELAAEFGGQVLALPNWPQDLVDGRMPDWCDVASCSAFRQRIGPGQGESRGTTSAPDESVGHGRVHNGHAGDERQRGPATVFPGGNVAPIGYPRPGETRKGGLTDALPGTDQSCAVPSRVRNVPPDKEEAKAETAAGSSTPRKVPGNQSMDENQPADSGGRPIWVSVRRCCKDPDESATHSAGEARPASPEYAP